MKNGMNSKKVNEVIALKKQLKKEKMAEKIIKKTEKKMKKNKLKKYTFIIATKRSIAHILCPWPCVCINNPFIEEEVIDLIRELGHNVVFRSTNSSYNYHDHVYDIDL